MYCNCPYQHVSLEIICILLFIINNTGKYVASFGDGPGLYKKFLLETGMLKGYDAYDGAPFSEEISEGRVQFLDLTLPQYGINILCL